MKDTLKVLLIHVPSESLKRIAYAHDQTKWPYLFRTVPDYFEAKRIIEVKGRYKP